MTSHEPASPTATSPEARRPVLLARSRVSSPARAIPPVHLIPLPLISSPLRAEPASSLSARRSVRALCGVQLDAEQIETVTPQDGVPCALCLVVHVTNDPGPLPATPAPDGPEPGLLAAADEYRSWGWPVTLRGEQIWLSLGTNAVALIIPTALATDVTAILAARRCPAPVLAHPGVPDRRIVLGSEPYGVPLPWPAEVHQVTGEVPLPPTATHRGRLTWTQRPDADALRLSREIDIFGALHTLVRVASGQ